MLFGVTVWEINFLAVLPVIAPELTGRLDLATQLWNGIMSYCLVYGPVLAAVRHLGASRHARPVVAH